jgi:outer membrane lipoprotein-sorting protein
VRVKQTACLLGLLVSGTFFAAAGAAQTQNPELLLPEQSAAKAKQLIQQAIQALGGDAYLNLRDVTCTGRASQFGHSGELTGYEEFFDYTKLPDKERTEYSSKRNIIEVYNGDQGWILDRGGVQDAPEEAINERRENQKKDIDTIFRTRIKEPGMIFRYAGPDVVDLKEADWVELVDSEGRTIRIAFDHATHLPLRKVVITRDPATRLRMEEKEYYSNYHPIQGLETPFQFAADRNGLKTSQVFMKECQYNTGLSDSLFTKESLEERWAKVGKKKKKK